MSFSTKMPDPQRVTDSNKPAYAGARVPELRQERERTGISGDPELAPRVARFGATIAISGGTMPLEPKQLIELALIVALAGVLFLYRRKIADWLSGNLRGGGPRPPSHPLPGNDGFILRRKRRTAAFSPE
jgi:hypothetical protein